MLTATGDAPADGRLAATAHFSVTLNGTSPVTVVVGRDPTNNGLDDLVADLNSSLKFSGLGGLVAAGRNGSRITLNVGHRFDAARRRRGVGYGRDADVPAGRRQRCAVGTACVSGQRRQVNIASQIVDSSISGARRWGFSR